MELIKKIGLEESESKVYLALLELGPSTVSEITARAGITRTLGYHVLQNLNNFGLVNMVSGKGAKIIYAAEHPSHLAQHIKNKKDSWESQLKNLEGTLPALVSLFKVADKPTVRYAQGVAGIKSIYSETLESKFEILSIMDIEGWDVPEFRQWGQEYNKARSVKQIHERILMLDTRSARAWMRDYRGSWKYTNYRWIKPEQLPGIIDLGGEINIYENKVMMALTKKPNRMGILIESTALSNLLRGMFELAWKHGVVVRR